MKRFLPPSLVSKRLHHRGAALVIVLAFVVLLTGLVVAYFSRSINDRQLSNSSYNGTNADAFARSAVDLIVADLKQEIVNGSNPAYPSPSPASGTIYYPSSNANMIPTTSGTPASGVVIPNLIRRSVRDNGPSGVNPMPLPGVPSRASTVNSQSDASINGRSISLARWNKHYLIPKANTSDDKSDPVSSFVAPDWVAVTAEKGPAILSIPFKDSGGTDVTPIGRYAYAIYDEGGLLDANVAGYPNGTTPGQSGYKSSLAYADLTTLPYPLPNSSPYQVDKLVGWRNYATTQPSNAFPGSTFAANFRTDPNPALNYFNYLLSNSSGFLTTGLNIWNNRTDQRFLSRQQLIAYQGSSGFSVNALQYLTTFSRDLNQPSFVRTQSVDSTAPGYDANAPKVLAATAGGNNATGFDSAINPSFLSVRVQTYKSGGRNNGKDLVAGEPLVKTRFNLTRLAWLTCQGPSGPSTANPTGRSTTDADIQALINSSPAITAEFLKLGTDARIASYFGLQWDTSSAPSHWKYIHGTGGTNGPIMKLNNPSDSTDVVRANREPDFFELLKASINVGSIAKTLTASGIGDNAFKAQYNADSSTDYAAIQIGANIIDQFDTDGYPTRITFDDGTGAREFYGVENLPYLNRVRNSVIKVQAPVLAGTSAPNPYGGVDYPSDTNLIANTGVGAFMIYPELWNPHDYNASTSSLPQTMGATGPVDQTAPQFRIYATTNTSTALNAHLGGAPPGNTPSSGTVAADQTTSPGYGSLYGFPWVGEQRILNQANTEMTFKIDRTTTGSTLFREPTILFQPNRPTGTNLTSTAISTKTGLGILANTAGFFAAGAAGGMGIKSDIATTDSTGLPAQNVGYIGFYLGAHPLQWTRGSTRYGARQTGILGTASLTYTLQCKDPSGNWITYDEKSQVITGNPDDQIMKGPEWGFIHNQGKGGTMATVVDPRSSRFDLMPTYIPNGYGTYRFPPWTGALANDAVKTGWLNKAEGIVLTSRNGYAGGNVVAGGQSWSPTSAMGWYPGGWESGNARNPFFQTGLFSENDPSFIPQVNLSDQLGNGGDGTPAGTGNATYYADPDGVVRRAGGGFNSQSALGTGQSTTASNAPGLPLATANTTGSTRAAQSDSRPFILNRPFRSVAELGYVMSATPWKNLNFNFPESGDTALLDVFCTQDTDDSSAMVAGRVDLNTRQAPVLQAIIAGAYRDEWNAATTLMTGSISANAAGALVARTTSTTVGKGPLRNVGELVGAWKGTSSTAPVMPTAGYDGFSADLSSVLTNSSDVNIQRFRESTMRALSNSGQTRVWNLLIDTVAQTGRYPASATTAADLPKFVVEGEQRYWVHVAIDRLTGQVIDKQIEVVKE